MRKYLCGVQEPVAELCIATFATGKLHLDITQFTSPQHPGEVTLEAWRPFAERAKAESEECQRRSYCSFGNERQASDLSFSIPSRLLPRYYSLSRSTCVRKSSSSTAMSPKALVASSGEFPSSPLQRLRGHYSAHLLHCGDELREVALCERSRDRC